jgi:hypothetical protein
MTRRGLWFPALLVILCAAPQLAAQDDERITRLEQKLDELLRQADEIRQELNTLKGTPTEPAATPSEDLTAVDVTTAEAVTPTAAAPASSKALNPDISVLGTFLSHAGDNFENRDRIALEEAEVAFEAFIDPYAKGKFFIAVTPEEVDVEEGYAQFVTLPWGLTAKAGKTKATFGKANTWHTHTRPWVDQPMMVTRFLGDEGLADVGLSVSKSIDNPFGAFLEATGEVYSGSDDDLLYNAHLKFFRDLGENSNIELGTSYAHEGDNRLAGVDATYRWKPLSRAIYNSVIARVEALAADQSGGDSTLYGGYASLDYQVARRWFVGGRLDRADRDRGVSGTITFWPSEFSQLRGQYRRTKFGNGPSFNEFFLQLQFAIGAHGAHVF